MKIHYAAKGLELSGELEKYANSKVMRLARKVPRSQRAYASCKVSFAQSSRKGTKYSTCSITFWLDDTELRAAETTQHMYAALDIAVVHIEQQLKDYARKRRRGLLKRRLRGT